MKRCKIGRSHKEPSGAAPSLALPEVPTDSITSFNVRGRQARFQNGNTIQGITAQWAHRAGKTSFVTAIRMVRSMKRIGSSWARRRTRV